MEPSHKDRMASAAPGSLPWNWRLSSEPKHRLETHMRHLENQEISDAMFVTITLALLLGFCPVLVLGKPGVATSFPRPRSERIGSR
jgi:hypothetical protein